MSLPRLLPFVLAVGVSFPSVQTRPATEVETGARLGVRLGHLVKINEVVLSPDGTTLATAGVGDIKFWDVATGGPRRARIPQSGRIAFSPDGRTLAVIPTPADVELWDVESGRLLKRMTDSGAPEHEILRQLQFAPDGRTVVLGGDDRTAVFDVTSGLLKQALPGGSVAFSGDARTLAYANRLRNDVVLYDTATMTVQKTITERLGTVETVCFSPDGRLGMGIKTLKDGIVAVADTGTSTILWSRTVRNGGDPEDVSCSADGQAVAAIFRGGSRALRRGDR
jgi:WD40 repeat protein